MLADVQNGRLVEGGLPGKLGGPDEAAVVKHARQQWHVRAATATVSLLGLAAAFVAYVTCDA